MAQSLATLFAVLAWCGCTTPEKVAEALTNHEKNTKMETVPERIRSAERSLAFKLTARFATERGLGKSHSTLPQPIRATSSLEMGELSPSKR